MKKLRERLTTRRDSVSVPEEGPGIHHLCQHGSAQDVRALVDSHGEYVIRQQDRQGQSPLHVAAYEAKLDIVMLLREKGADVNLRDNNGWTAMHSCCAATSPNGMTVAKYLLATSSAAQVDALSNSGATPLHYLARGHCIGGEDRQMVGGGISPSASPSASPVMRMKSATVGADARLRNERHFEETVKMLVSRGADINTRTKYGETPLHQAAAHGNALGVKSLAALGADLNFQNKNGETSLHVAIRSRATEAAIRLLDAGADPLIRSRLKVRIDRKDSGVCRSTSVASLRSFSFSSEDFSDVESDGGGGVFADAEGDERGANGIGLGGGEDSSTCGSEGGPGGTSGDSSSSSSTGLGGRRKGSDQPLDRRLSMREEDGSDCVEYAIFYENQVVTEKMAELYPDLRERIDGAKELLIKETGWSRRTPTSSRRELTRSFSSGFRKLGSSSLSQESRATQAGQESPRSSTSLSERVVVDE